jgi:hypothetical protein
MWKMKVTRTKRLTKRRKSKNLVSGTVYINTLMYLSTRKTNNISYLYLLPFAFEYNQDSYTKAMCMSKVYPILINPSHININSY